MRWRIFPMDELKMHDAERFKLSKYILPSIVSMAVVGTNANVDGLFIGRILGDAGLAAINIVWPIVALIASVGTGIGIGASVLVNRARGMGNPLLAEKYKNTALVLLGILSLLFGALLFILSEPVLVLLGAEGEVLSLAVSYSRAICAGAALQIFGAALIVLQRNDAKTYSSMVYSLIGLALHVALDLILAKPLSMTGVALATVISQGIVAVLSMLTLGINREGGVRLSLIKDISVHSFAPLGINFVPSLVLLFTNAFAMSFGGVEAVSAYACMSYAVYTFDYVFQGTCDGIQPVVSYTRGSGNIKEERRSVRCAGIILLATAAVSVALTPVLIKVMPTFLGTSKEAESIVRIAFPIYAVSYLPKAFVKLVCSYYYASGRSLLSNILVYLDPLVLAPVSLYFLTLGFGTDGVWLSLPISQIIMALVCACAVLLDRRKNKNIEVL